MPACEFGCTCRRHRQTAQHRAKVSATLRGNARARTTGNHAYSAAHNRVRLERGSASAHVCVDGCGRNADHWSLRHDAAIIEHRPTDGLAFSRDPNDYDARCVSCHSAYDHADSTADPMWATG